MASITKVTTSKGIGYRISYYDMDGNRHRKIVYSDRPTADNIAKEIEYKKSRVLNGFEQKHDSNISFQTAKKYYLRNIEDQKEPSTIVREKKVYKAFSKYIGETPIGRTKISDIEGYIKTRSEIDKVSPAGIGLELRTLRAFFNYLIKRGYLKTNPVSGVKGPRQKDKKIRFLTTAEIKNLLAVVDDPGYRDLILMYLNTGARREEILPSKFTWSNVDFKQHEIKLTGKRNKTRYVPMNELVFQLLRRRRFIEKQEFPFDFNYEYLFKKIAKYYIAAGIKNANVHTLRKTFGSLMVQAGENILAVSKLLGHSSVRVTEKHYADLLGSNLVTAVKSLDGKM